MTGEAASGGQRHVERPPIAPLADIVSVAWVQQVPTGAAPYVHRHIPNGAVEIRCVVGAEPQLVGPLSSPLVEEFAPGTTMVGVRLVPGAAATAAGLPASEIADQVLDAEQLWGAPARALGEAVDAAASPGEALAVVQRSLLERVRVGDDPDPLVAEAVRRLMPWRERDVTSLTASLHISETQLRRRCRTAVGLAPKALHRMLRFQGFLALVQHTIAQGRSPSEDGLAALAARAGYADQPHLTRECVRLTGTSPRVFLQQTVQSCSCGHDHTASFAPLLRAAGRRGAT